MRHILLVEGNPAHMAQIARWMAEVPSVSVVQTARTAHEAVDAVQHNLFRFDLLIVDIDLPDLSGLSFIRYIKDPQQGEGWRVPVIALSASDSTEMMAKAFEVNSWDFLRKPPDLEQLKAELVKRADVWMGVAEGSPEEE